MINLSRWPLIFIAVLSGIIWLVISSVTANAVHIFAKSDFSAEVFGSASMWTVVVVFSWSLSILSAFYFPRIVGYAMRATLGALVIVAWVVVLLLFSAIKDEMLGRLGVAAVGVWILEIIVTYILVQVANRSLLQDYGAHGFLVAIIVSLAWLAFVKALLLCIFPGIDIKPA